jgi:peptidylprolyl isomerase/FKBP-type peptidyl-prolyl cis-trans isomerase FklB
MRRLALALILATLSLPACADPPVSAAQWQARSDAFLAANAKRPGVVVLRDGLQYKVTTAGPAGGASPQASDHVLVNYEARLMDGTVIDSSFKRGQPAVFTVDELVPAWTEALRKMKPGDDWMLYSPPKLAYGSDGKGPIPPNSALVFRIQLISVLPRDVSVGDG